MPGILSPFKAAGRGLNGILNLGTQNALGAVGGDLNQVNPQDRAALRSNFLMSLGRGIQTGDIGGNIQQFQQGQAAPLLDFRAKQAEAARVAQEQEALKQQQAAMQQRLAEAQAAGGNQGFANEALLQGNSALANAAANVSKSFAPEVKEPTVINPRDVVKTVDGRTGIIRSDGSFVPTPEPKEGEEWKQLGNTLYNPDTKEWVIPPQAPKFLSVNGRPAIAKPDGQFTALDGKPIDPGTIRSVSELPNSAQGQVFQGLVEKYGGDATRAAAEFGAMSKPESSSDAAAIADGIVAGTIPPDLTGYYRMKSEIVSELAKRGYDLTTAGLDYGAEKKHLSTLNGVQMNRVRQATNFAYHSLDLVDYHSGKLSRLVDRTRFPVFNKALIAAAKGGAMGNDAQVAATELDTQIKDLQSELATVFKGGNSPTDKGLEQASEMLSSDWTEETLKAATNLARKNLALRLNAIKETTPILSGKTEGEKEAGVPSGTRLERGPDGKLRLVQ